jgi:hypothetical protein
MEEEVVEEKELVAGVLMAQTVDYPLLITT